MPAHIPQVVPGSDPFSHGSSATVTPEMVAVIAAGLIGVLLAGLAHEATHALVARLVGGRIRDVRLGLYRWEIHYELPSEASYWRDRLVGWAPMTIGVLAGAWWLHVSGPPQVSLTSLLATIVWLTYTRPSPSDLSVRVAHSDPLTTWPHVDADLALWAASLCVFTLSMGVALWGAPLLADLSWRLVATIQLLALLWAAITAGTAFIFARATTAGTAAPGA